MTLAKGEAERTAARASEEDVLNVEAADCLAVSWQSWDKHQEFPNIASLFGINR
jgi:hypothetical protein